MSVADPGIPRVVVVDEALGAAREEVILFGGGAGGGGGVNSGALTNRSGTLTTGGVSQQLAAANAGRKYLFVQNLSAGDLWLNFTSAASAGGSSIKLQPNVGFEMSGDFVSTEAVTLFGATSGQAFVAKEG